MKTLIVGGAWYREIDPKEILEAGDADLVDFAVFYPIHPSQVGLASGKTGTVGRVSIRVRRLNTEPKTEAPKPYTERDIIELIVRAPACPEWFEPDMSRYDNPAKYSSHVEKTPDGMSHAVGGPDLFAVAQFQVETKKQATIQWPRAYALIVLEAK